MYRTEQIKKKKKGDKNDWYYVIEYWLMEWINETEDMEKEQMC